MSEIYNPLANGQKIIFKKSGNSLDNRKYLNSFPVSSIPKSF